MRMRVGHPRATPPPSHLRLYPRTDLRGIASLSPLCDTERIVYDRVREETKAHPPKTHCAGEVVVWLSASGLRVSTPVILYEGSTTYQWYRLVLPMQECFNAPFNKLVRPRRGSWADYQMTCISRSQRREAEAELLRKMNYEIPIVAQPLHNPFHLLSSKASARTKSSVTGLALLT